MGRRIHTGTISFRFIAGENVKASATREIPFAVFVALDHYERPSVGRVISPFDAMSGANRVPIAQSTDTPQCLWNSWSFWLLPSLW